jgi:hypothetical protein
MFQRSIFQWFQCFISRYFLRAYVSTTTFVHERGKFAVICSHSTLDRCSACVPLPFLWSNLSISYDNKKKMLYYFLCIHSHLCHCTMYSALLEHKIVEIWMNCDQDGGNICHLKGQSHEKVYEFLI